MTKPYLVLELTHEQADALRSVFSVHGNGVLPYPLRIVDHLVGRRLGCDPYVLYQDALFPYRDRLVRPDGTLDLNLAETVLAAFDEHDLNLAERVLREWGAGPRE